jgi:shikimate dehydrogenase
VNLSIPHKEAALGLLDEVSVEAREIGAVNTVVRDGARLLGRNTDAPGFLASLEEVALGVEGAEALVLGAGGAGRAVAWALARAGARVRVWNRSEGRAVALAAEFGLEAVPDVALPGAARASSLIVNATSLGLGGAEVSAVPPGAWPPGGAAVDIVYRPLETRFLREAREAGLRTVDGLGMLVHQGALALEAWLAASGGRMSAPRAVMRAAALEALGESAG